MFDRAGNVVLRRAQTAASIPVNILTTRGGSSFLEFMRSIRACTNMQCEQSKVRPKNGGKRNKHALTHAITVLAGWLLAAAE